MTYDEFVKAYNGKATDYDGAYGAQCVDLIKLYLDKVFGIKPGSWGNARFYWIDYPKHSELVKAFDRISNTPSFIPKKGDIMVWNANKGAGAGHIAICTGEGTTSYFYSYDQNWSAKKMTREKHDYDDVYGVLRPKDQSKVGGSTSFSGTSSSSVGYYVPSVKWQNGSTTEKVYARSDFKEEIGSLAPGEAAKCFGKKGSAYCVQYDLDGTSKHKVGFVKYAGGVTNAPTSGRNYKNGSTSETVYTDTAKKGKAGSLDKNEACLCPTKTDGMFLVIYKVNGTSAYKCGYTVYDGGVE